MAEKPLVTYIILGYNQQEFIREAIQSAFNQDYSPLEIILSDDKSTDKTFDIMQEMAELYKGSHRLILNQNIKNLGIASHINTTVAMANGEIISWAAGDDISMPNKVSLLIEPFIKKETCMGSHSRATRITTDGELLDDITPRSRHIRNSKDLIEIIRDGHGLASQCFAFKKSVFTHFGNINKSVTNEGKVMVFRVCSLGELCYVDSPTIYYRVGSGTSTQTEISAQRRLKKEPQKISGWNYFALKQIKEDSKKLSLSQKLQALLEERLFYYKHLHQVRANDFQISSLIKLLQKREYYRAGLTSFFKKNLPIYVLKLFYK